MPRFGPLHIFEPRDALGRFRDAAGDSWDAGLANAADALLREAAGPVALVSVFRRYRDTGTPPDGGRNGALPVLAAAGIEGVSWAVRDPGRVPSAVAGTAGVDEYVHFEMVTFHMAEVLLEGGAQGDIGFGTEYETPTDEGGVYQRALRFTLACSELGFGGRAKATDAFTPTAENIAEARRALGLPTTN